MSVGFGFSVGDFINATKLVSTVIDALRESGEAGEEFRELLHQLYSLETALLCVKRLELDETQHAEYLALQQAAAQCQRTIDAFWEKTHPFQKNLGPFVTTTSRLKDKWMRMKWAVCKKEDVARLKADLAGHTASIHLLLSTLQMAELGLHARKQDNRQQRLATRIQSSYFRCMSRLSTISKQISSGLEVGKRLLEMTTQVVRTNVQVFQIVLGLHNAITQVARQQPVYLIDGLGRMSPFHLEFIRSKEALVAVIAANFKKYEADDKILNGEFVIEDSISKQDIDLNTDWDLCFSPGQRVEMSMIFKRAQIPASTCPRCKTDCVGDQDRDNECNACGFLYRRIVDMGDQDSFEEVPSIKGTETKGFPLARTPPGLLPPLLGGKPIQSKRKAENDIGLFRKVRIISKSYPRKGIVATTHRRCRCYQLQGKEWLYMGTGEYDILRTLGHRGAILAVKDESIYGREILKNHIDYETVFRNEKEKLLAWPDACGINVALSFEKDEGFDWLWGFIKSQSRKATPVATKPLADRFTAF